MLHQREPLTHYISCPVCCKIFNDNQQRPISLSCGHTVCKSCLHGRLGNERCPYDQEPFPDDAEKLPANYALMQLVEATSSKKSSDDTHLLDSDQPECYETARQCIQEISVYLKPLAENSSDDEGSTGHVPPSAPQTTDKAPTKCLLSRPLQRKVISLIQCQILEEEGRSRAARIARSIGERVVSELLSLQQFPHQLSANLWAAVRARGCQFLGPAMQEEALKLILLTLEDGFMLSRKTLVLYVVDKLSSTYPHASKTAIGHVVQLLYRASCFKVAKRDEESSLMQLKEEFREYEALRKEHDAQIVQIAMEAGIRIPPEQWSSLLYGDLVHKSHMQSIMDKLQNPQSFSQCVLELIQVLQRNGDPGGFLKLRHRFEFLSYVDPSPDAQVPSLQDVKAIMQSLNMIMKAFVNFLSMPSPRIHADSQAVPNARFKTSMCRDMAAKGVCPRGNSCTFAHSQEELDRHRLRSRRSMNKQGLKADGGAIQSKSDDDAESCPPGDDTYLMKKDSKHTMGPADCRSSDKDLPSSSFERPTAVAGIVDGLVDSGIVNVSPSLPPPPNFPATLLTFSQPAEEASGVPFCPRLGLQTSFHPHNMRAPPPPFISPMTHEGYPTANVLTRPPSMGPQFNGQQINLSFQGHLQQHPSHGHLQYQNTSQTLPVASDNKDNNSDNNSVLNSTGGSAEILGESGRDMADRRVQLTSERGYGLLPPSDAVSDFEHYHTESRLTTQSFGGPDGALQTLTCDMQSLLRQPRENSLEDLKSRKKEIINNLQEEPMFLNTRNPMYSGDSVKGGFDGLKTVLGKNQRNRESMPKLVSDMYVATRSTQSLDMLEPCDWSAGEHKEQSLPSSIPEGPPQHAVNGCYPPSCTVITVPVSEHTSPLRPRRAYPNRGLFNTLGSSFDISSNLSSIAGGVYPDTEFSHFPTDDDDETFIPYEQTVVSRFGPISRMARAKTNDCAPVQVTADSCKKMTPVLAVTPLERPVPVAMSVNSRFGSFREQCPEPSVKPTPTESPSIWQESPLPSQKNIALLRAGAADAVSNNERLAYELQAVELEISLKTGKDPESVQKLIHEAVMSCPSGTTLSYPSTNTMPPSYMVSGHRPVSMMTQTQPGPYVNPGTSMGNGHITDCLANIEHGSSSVSSETAARDVMEEYYRSWKGVKKYP